MSWRGAAFGILLLSIGLVSCGKNDPIIPYAPVQAPAPPNYAPQGGGFVPGGGYNPGFNPGGGYNPGQFFPQSPMGNFRPQIPQGYPPQFYPFVPIDNYMRQDPRLQQHWQQMWWQWQGYAQMRHRSPYDFSTFWYEYCPQQWGQGPWSELYRYFDSNFYYWAQPGIQFRVPSQFSVDFFWGNAYDFPMPQYDLCDYGCY